jgi:hypothetical protein
MKKILIYGSILSVLLVVLLSGCQKNLTGQAFARSMETNCQTWKTGCEKGNQAACRYFNKYCVDVPTYEEVQNMISEGIELIPPVEVKGDGMLAPAIDFDNSQLGGAVIRFKEQGDIKAAITGGSFGFTESMITLNADRIRMEKLSGSGNAYACLDSDGYLFRSDTPCK